MARNHNFNSADHLLLPQFLQYTISQHLSLLFVTFNLIAVCDGWSDADIDLIVIIVLQIDIYVQIGFLLFSGFDEVSLCQLYDSTSEHQRVFVVYFGLNKRLVYFIPRKQSFEHFLFIITY
jgi:hypothetical protein